MNKNEFFKLKSIMQLRGLSFDWRRLNQVRHHSKRDGETWEHYLLKAITGKILNDLGHSYFTEFEFPNKTEADIYDVTANIVIEFETRFSAKVEWKKYLQFKKYIGDIFVFKVGELIKDKRNVDTTQIEKTIRKKIGY